MALSGNHPASLRIAMVTGSWPPVACGIADYSRHVVHALRARGHAVDVYTRTSGAEESGVHGGIEGWGGGDLGALLARIAAGRPDIVHLQHQTSLYGRGLAITRFSGLVDERVPGARPVVTLHDLEAPRLFPRLARSGVPALRRLARRAAGVVVTNELDRAAVLEWGLGRERVCLVPVGPAIVPSAEHLMAGPAVRASLGVGAGDTVFVHFGTGADDRGIDAILGAARLLPPHGWRLLLMVTARTPRERRRREAWVRRASELRIADRVTWRESLAAAEVSRHLAAADVGLLPYDEGLTTRRTTFAIMAAHGLPIVSTQPRIWPRVFGAESPAYLVPPGNPAALSRVMRELMPPSAGRDDLRRRALACAKKLSWEECARKTEMLYREAGRIQQVE